MGKRSISRSMEQSALSRNKAFSIYLKINAASSRGDVTICDIQSYVPFKVFEVFVKALETHTAVPVTKENMASISLLASDLELS
jgi:hypothetical protein